VSVTTSEFLEGHGRHSEQELGEWCERGDSLEPHGIPRQILSSSRKKNRRLAPIGDAEALSAALSGS